MKTWTKSIVLAFLLIVGFWPYTGITQNSKSKPSWGFSGFTKPKENPILGADSTKIFFCPVKKAEIKWQRADVFNPAAIVHDGKVYLLTRCEDNPKAHLGGRTSRIGLASSADGIHFEYYPAPVLYPDNDEFAKYDHMGGCEDPRVVKTDEGLFVMLYTSWNYDTPRLSVATSKDLIHWQKKGPAFAKAYNGKFLNMASKSGSIVTRMKNGNQTVAKFNGKFYMYWGEHGVNLAISDNLTDWYPNVDDKGNLRKIIVPRAGYFDSALTECGPPALLTDKGILLLYNGKNSDGDNSDPNLPKGTYSVGQVLIDPANPEMVLERSDSYILKPTLPHEQTGQYKSGTVFGEGLIYFKNKWFLYYGTADSFIGVAVTEVKL
ncbi:MAG TPA: hypothetical protein DCR40_13260 [Prolixibacteraceae bacterium]|nr:hypothetical protein [Prolixibacteraceae bacterium]